MANHPNNGDEPLHELKHEAVPGYMRAFIIAFAVMMIYLAVILVSSPGPAKGHHDDHEEHTTPAETGNHDDSQ